MASGFVRIHNTSRQSIASKPVRTQVWTICPGRDALHIRATDVAHVPLSFPCGAYGRLGSRKRGGTGGREGESLWRGATFVQPRGGDDTAKAASTNVATTERIHNLPRSSLSRRRPPLSLSPPTPLACSLVFSSPPRFCTLLDVVFCLCHARTYC